MLGQDIIHAAINSQVKTPKHIGLAVPVHHLTGSKEVVTLLNRMGHCSSYDDVKIVNTVWAREMEARSQQTGVVIPLNIIPGQFRGISWQHMERDGKGEACGGSEIGVGRVFHEQRGHACYHTK